MCVCVCVCFCVCVCVCFFFSPRIEASEVFDKSEGFYVVGKVRVDGDGQVVR